MSTKCRQTLFELNILSSHTLYLPSLHMLPLHLNPAVKERSSVCLICASVCHVCVSMGGGSFIYLLNATIFIYAHVLVPMLIKHRLAALNCRGCTVCILWTLTNKLILITFRHGCKFWENVWGDIININFITVRFVYGGSVDTKISKLFIESSFKQDMITFSVNMNKTRKFFSDKWLKIFNC